MAGRSRGSMAEMAALPPVRGLARRVTIGAGWMLALRWSDRVIALGAIAVLAGLPDGAERRVIALLKPSSRQAASHG